MGNRSSGCRDIRAGYTLRAFPVCIVKAMVPVVMYGCENWTIKKTEHWRIDAFKFWCWRRLWRVPWTARRSNRSVLKEINPEYLLEELLLNLQYFSHLMRRANLLDKTLMLGKIDGKRRRRLQRLRWLDSIINSMDMNLSRLQEIVEDRAVLHVSLYRVTKSLTGLSSLTTTTTTNYMQWIRGICQHFKLQA